MKISEITITDIIVKERKRGLSEEKVREIANSIKEIGLINPITIDKENVLVTGFHRYSAFKLLNRDVIPAITYEEENELKRELIEIDENLIRYNFHYTEEGDMLLERKRIYEVLHPETKVGQYGHKGGKVLEKGIMNFSTKLSFVEDTAKKTDKSESVIKRNIQISKNIVDDLKPKLREFEIPKTVALEIAKLDKEKQYKVMEDGEVTEGKIGIKKAVKKIRDEEKRKDVERKAMEADIEHNFDENIKLGSAKELMKNVENNSVDLILTDPPYFVSEDNIDIKFKDRSDIKKDQAEWDKQKVEILLDVLPDMHRVLKDGGSIYVMTQDSLIGLLQSELSKVGFVPHATIVWHKTNPSPGAVKTQFCSSCEYIVFATKGEKHIFNSNNGWNRHNFMEGSICMGSERYLHPTQKPVYLFEELMKISSNRGDVVLDPFAGTGTTGVVAKKLERNFILFERKKEYMDIIKVRLGNE